MSRKLLTRMAFTVCTLAMLAATYDEAAARAGGSRSIGSRGSRTYRSPSQPVSPSQTYRPQPSPVAPQQQPFSQPQRQSGGFLRSMAGGIIGGMLGGMLFRSLGFGGGWGGGGGIGIFDILLIGGILYLIYRFIAKRRQQSNSGQIGQQTWQQAQSYEQPSQDYGYQQAPAVDETSFGLAHIRQMDASFDETRFQETAQDIFFRIQGAWTRRDLSSVDTLLSGEMRGLLQQDIDDLKRRSQINRLENIAVREVVITEAWQEEGKDYITVRFLANLLDYTTDESGHILSGSDRDPVKFEEFWTFTRPVGPNPWQLSAIQQT